MVNEQIKAYLEEKSAKKAAAEKERRAKILLREGLFTKEELPERPESLTDDYGGFESERDEQGNVLIHYFRKVPLEVSDEEWEQIEKYAEVKDKDEEKDSSGVASLLKGLAVVVYLLGFILGIAMGKTLLGDFSFGIMLVYWIAGLFAGTLLLGFSEVIRLLHEINQKTK